VHHSERGSQYASEDYRAVLQKHGLTGSMGRAVRPEPRVPREATSPTSPGRTSRWASASGNAAGYARTQQARPFSRRNDLRYVHVVRSHHAYRKFITDD
jgi:transposase InsO family protein